jgi:hypothetical protein
LTDPLDLNFETGEPDGEALGEALADALGEPDGEAVGEALADALDEAVALADADALADGVGLEAVTTIVALFALLLVGVEATGNETFLVMVAVIPIFLS